MRTVPFVSVVVPAYNEEKYILKCLDSLFNQTVDKKVYEVIVALSSKTTDKTEEKIKKYPVKTIYIKGGVAMGRYQGFRIAKGDILAGTDADTAVPKDWIENIISAFNDPNVVSVTGPVLPDPLAPFRERLYYYLALAFYLTYSTADRKKYLSGNNFAVRRDAYFKCGEFKRHLKSGEETELTHRICKYGKIVYDKKIRIRTSTRRTQEGYIKSFIRYSKVFILLRLGKPTPDFPHIR